MDRVHCNRLWSLAIAIGMAAGMPSDVAAQTFPSKTLRIIVPFPPGGAADVLCRVLAENMSKGLGQSFIIENRPGAQGIVGYDYGARVPADGHTMVNVFSSFLISPLVRDKVPYDPFKDFKAVGEMMVTPMAIAVHPSLPAKSLKELIALAQARPGELSFAALGGGGLHNIYGELLKSAANIKITNIPFQGGILASQATAGGHVPIVVANVSEMVAFVKSGRLRALVVSTGSRADAFPDVPTMREVGYPQLEAGNWAGLMVPAATPSAAITSLNKALVSALNDAQIREKLRVQDMLPRPGTPDQFAAQLQSESARYAKIVKQAGIRVE
jgi:tripartite-type tricarboxylate transporter receptor subunit TctC